MKNEKGSCCTSYQPSKEEHLANIITHAIPIIPSIWWFFELKNLSKSQLIILTLYGLSMIAIFLISSLFHYYSYLGNKEKLRKFFHYGDRVIIYIFIAASYTPWLSIPGCNTLTKSIVPLVWMAALCGCIMPHIMEERVWSQYELTMYLAVGVIPATLITFYHANTPSISGFVKGCLAYVSGIYFFRSDGFIPYAHAIWHLFVVLGVTFQYHALRQLLIQYLNIAHNDGGQNFCQ